MGIGKKMSKGSIGGGVNISHKSKMSQSAKNQMSFPGGMPGPGDYGKVVGKGMAKYLSGESVGMKKYGKHKGPAQAKPDYIDIDGDGNKTESMKQAADGMGKYGNESKGAAKMSRKERQEKRAQKRVNRGEKRVEKLQKKIDAGKDSEGYKASRLKARQKRVDENKKSVGKDFVSDKDKKTATKKDVKKDVKPDLLTVRQKKEREENKKNSEKNKKTINTKPKFEKVDLVSKSKKEGGVPKAGDMKKVKSVKAGNLKSYDLPGHGEMINKRVYMDPKNIKAKVLKK